MKFNEFLTKVSIILSGIGFAVSGIFSYTFSLFIVVILLIASFVRDDDLRTRQRVRLTPTFGITFIATYVFLFMINSISPDHTPIFTQSQLIAVSGLGGLFIKTITLLTESWSIKTTKIIQDFYDQNFGPQIPQMPPEPPPQEIPQDPNSVPITPRKR